MSTQFRHLFIAALTVGFAVAATVPALAMRTHTMQKGDTLWDLSAKHYGDPMVYPVFLEINNIANPRTIPIGRKILIPDFDAMKRIAQEANPEKRRRLISQIAGGAATPGTVEPAPRPPSANPAEATPTTPSPGPINPRDVSLRKIFGGPDVPGGDLRKVDTAPEERR